MNRVLLPAALAVFLAACGGGGNQTCNDTGCAANERCNATTGRCEATVGGGTGGSGGGTTGGGMGGGGGGGAVDAGPEDAGTGGGGETFDAGFDAGVVDAGIIDPFDDGGVFTPGDICTYALPVHFDGGTDAVVQVDLAQQTDQYTASCGTGATGADAIFVLTVTEPKGLIVTATNASGTTQNPALSLLRDPCAAFTEVACSNSTDETGPEVLNVSYLAAGTWYVLLDNTGTGFVDGTYDVAFQLVDATEPPGNDTCAMAEPLVFANDTVSVSGTTSIALNDNPGAPLSCSMLSSTQPDVFYSFTLTDAHDVHVVLAATNNSDLAPVAAILGGCGGAEVTCKTGSSGVDFIARNLQPGTYVLQVDGNSATPGDFMLTLELRPPVVPVGNDTCANPTTLVPNMSQMVNVATATRDYAPSCGTFGDGGDVIYTFTLAQPQKVTLNAVAVNGSDPVVSLRTTCTDDTSELRCRDRGGSDDDEVISYGSLPAGTYFVVLSSYRDTSTELGLSLTIDAPVPPPPNDTCATPTTLVPGMSQTVDNADVAADYEHGCAFSSGGDLVYQFTLTQPQKVVVHATAGNQDTNPIVSLRTTCVDDTSEFACADQTYSGEDETITESLLAAGTYFVILSTYDDSGTALGISLDVLPAPVAPMNETCGTATALVPNVSQSIDLAAAAHDYDVSCNASTSTAARDAVYSFTLASASRVSVELTGTGDGALELFGSPCGTGTSLACADDTSSGSEKVRQGNLAAGTYYVVVSSNSLTGDLSYGVELTVSPPQTNESCTNPLAVTFTNNTAAFDVSLIDATNDVDVTMEDPAESCVNYTDGGDLTYEVTVPAGKTLTVTGTPSPTSFLYGDFVLIGREPTCASAPGFACAPDDWISGDPAQLIVDNSAGTTPRLVYVIVKAYDFDPDFNSDVALEFVLSP